MTQLLATAIRTLTTSAALGIAGVMIFPSLFDGGEAQARDRGGYRVLTGHGATHARRNNGYRHNVRRAGRRTSVVVLSIGNSTQNPLASLPIKPLRSHALIIEVSAEQKALGARRAAMRQDTYSSGETAYTVLTKSEVSAGTRVEFQTPQVSAAHEEDEFPVVYFND